MQDPEVCIQTRRVLYHTADAAGRWACRDMEKEYAEAGERVIDAREEVNVRIPQELREKWQMFLDKQDSYHEWERRMEFDRGFYLAVRIILELLRGGLKL